MAVLQRRQSPRLRTLKAGKIVFNHKHSLIDCTIRNLSDSGACLQTPSTAGVPDSFELLFEADGATRPCRVAWRTETRIGVLFQ